MDGTTRFVVAYVVQAALDGHSIPVDAGTMAALGVLDLVTDKEAAAGEVPGMERAVGKSKGVEFGSLLHQLGADYLANPFSPQVREILLAIDPEASKRFPQRRQPRPNRRPGTRRHVPLSAEVAPPPPAAAPRKKKTEGRCRPSLRQTRQAATEAKRPKPRQPKARTSETKAAEMKPAEGKKAVGATSKKAAEACTRTAGPGKTARQAPKAEKARRKRREEKNTPRPRSLKKPKNTKSDPPRRQRPRRPQMASANANLGRIRHRRLSTIVMYAGLLQVARLAAVCRWAC